MLAGLSTWGLTRASGVIIPKVLSKSFQDILSVDCLAHLSPEYFHLKKAAQLKGHPCDPAHGWCDSDSRLARPLSSARALCGRSPPHATGRGSAAARLQVGAPPRPPPSRQPKGFSSSECDEGEKEGFSVCSSKWLYSFPEGRPDDNSEREHRQTTKSRGLQQLTRGGVVGREIWLLGGDRLTANGQTLGRNLRSLGLYIII